MNKAFTKEDDGDTPQTLPDLPISSHPNHVTPRGLAQLQARHAALEAEVARLRDMRDFTDDPMPLAIAQRDLRHASARLGSAMLVTLPEGDLTQVSFGTSVTVEDESGARATYTIVGEDEADPDIGLIAAFSPLARALMEASVGDIAEWPKPTGITELEVIAIERPKDSP